MYSQECGVSRCISLTTPEMSLNDSSYWPCEWCAATDSVSVTTPPAANATGRLTTFAKAMVVRRSLTRRRKVSPAYHRMSASVASADWRCTSRRACAATARRRRRQCAAFSDRLHVLQRAGERRGPRLSILFLGGIVAQRRIVIDQRVDQLRGRRGHRACFERAVIEDVWAAGAHRLRVGVRQLGLADEYFVGHRPYRAELTILALCNRAGNLEPLADIAVLADALPHVGSGLVDRDLHRNRDVGRVGDDCRVGCWQCGWSGRLRCGRSSDTSDQQEREHDSIHSSSDERPPEGSLYVTNHRARSAPLTRSNTRSGGGSPFAFASSTALS